MENPIHALSARVIPARIFFLAVLVSTGLIWCAQAETPATGPGPGKVFRAGAATSNITPAIGTSINGNFKDILVKNIHDETYARCIVLDDGQMRLAIVVSDLCMVSREVLDNAKKRAYEQTQIPVENMLMSATHSHSAGTACSVFQSDPSPEYLVFLTERIADAVIRANRNLAPARIGWGVGNLPTQVFNRRWKMKPGTPLPNPFGGQDQVRTNPGIGNPNALEPAGPTDPQIPVISVQSPSGSPIALLANYSLHYVGGTGDGEISADYYGMFADLMQRRMGSVQPGPPFVAIMSNGTSGDINNINVRGGKRTSTPAYAQMLRVASDVADEVHNVLQKIVYHDWVSLDARQKEISLGVRRPDAEEVEAAKEVISKAKGEVMMTKEEVYARETVLMSRYPDNVSIILQAFRIGEVSITAVPCEVFAATGLELKEKSPFKPTFNIELANGYNGYLPPPDQHRLGGYETWRARSSYLEVEAAPKITQTLFDLLRALKASEP